MSRSSFLRGLGAALCGLAMSPTSVLAAAAKRGAGKDAKTRPVEAILFYGQSNAGAGGDSTPVLTSPVYPDRVMTFRTSRQIYGTREVAPARLQGIGTLQDHPKSPPYPATAMAYALGHAAAPESGRSYFMHTVWYGGQPLTAFLPGTIPWSDLMAVAKRMPQAVGRKGRHGEVAALVWLQGESGPPGRERYGRLLNELLDRALPELKAQADQARLPIAILLQSNASNVQSATAAGVALAQWDVARARPEDAVLAGPSYQFPLGDAVHQSTVGRMMLGDLLAFVFDLRVEHGQLFEPLHPVSVRRERNVIVIAFKRPSGSMALQWDRDWIPATPDYGFRVQSRSGTAKIASVAITGPSEVTLELEPGAPTQGLRVRYAMEQPHEPGWAPGRGQLMAPTGRRSAFADLNVRIPKRIAHYAIRFELDVA